eukprot:1741649-Prymnesium_polylepis.1
MAKTFATDWQIMELRLERLLTLSHAQCRDRCVSFEEYKTQLKDTLFTEWRLVYGAFDYYAVLTSMDSEPHNVFYVSMNSFMKRVKCCGLITPDVTKAMYELMFIKATAEQ